MRLQVIMCNKRKLMMLLQQQRQIDVLLLMDAPRILLKLFIIFLACYVLSKQAIATLFDDILKTDRNQITA